ncbi:MAG: 50S ribosomal protein L37e, partial [Candidatus Aenigmarchaeota archaeon]|nr:50S ribosomal protein L37e [Candidatus Aenigmarchaeota archaeon]
GTPSKGKHSKGKSHMRCRRCGRFSYHVKKKVCSACGFGKSAKMKYYAWSAKKPNKVRVR